MGLRTDKAAVEAAYAAAEAAWEDERRELTAQCEHADARAFQSEGLCHELGEQLEAATRANAEALAEMCALRAVMKGASRADAQAEAEALAEALAEEAEANAAAREQLPPRTAPLSPVTHHSPSPGHTPHRPLLSPRAPAEPPLDGVFQGLERAPISAPKPFGRSTGGGGGGYSGGGPSGRSSSSSSTVSPGKRRRNSGERDPGPLASMDPVGERAPFSWTPTMTSARAGSDVWPRVNTSNAAARRGAGALGSQADKYDHLRRFTPAFAPAQGGYARSIKQQAPPPRPPPPGAAAAEPPSASAKVVTVDLF
jgi:hypothetical protein